MTLKEFSFVNNVPLYTKGGYTYIYNDVLSIDQRFDLYGLSDYVVSGKVGIVTYLVPR